MGTRSWLRWVVVSVVSVGLTHVGFSPFLLLFVVVVGVCRGHARLVDPPSRASAWRFGWGTPVDYNDNEGFCGGLTHQYRAQGGRCGVCGDAWGQNPRPHEAGGRYATGTIVRRYEEGQVIPIRVHVTANHRGHFEFRLCPNNNPQVEATQTCLNQHPLFLADGSGFQHEVAGHTGEHLLHLQLPTGLTCTQCVLQWRYVSGNNWGTCEDGSGRVGCGPQEEFRACADVAISTPPTGTSVELTSLTENGTDTRSQGITYSWFPKPTLTPSLTPTRSQGITYSWYPKPTLTPTRSQGITYSWYPKPTLTPSLTPTRSQGITYSWYPKPTLTPSLTPTRSQGITYSWYPKPTLTPTLMPTLTPTLTPTLRNTGRPPTHSPQPSSFPPITRRPRPSRLRPSKHRPGKSHPPKPRLGKSRPSRPRSSTPVPVSFPSEASKSCRAVGVWQRVPGMDSWCNKNCFHVPSFCPPSHCTCS